MTDMTEEIDAWFSKPNRADSLLISAEEAITDTLEGLEEEFHNKAVSVAAYIKGLEAEAEGMRVHLDNVKRRMAALENRAERLRTYLKDCMERSEHTEIKDARFSIKVKQCPAKVVLTGAPEMNPRPVAQHVEDWQEIQRLKDALSVTRDALKSLVYIVDHADKITFYTSAQEKRFNSDLRHARHILEYGKI